VGLEFSDSIVYRYFHNLLGFRLPSVGCDDSIVTGVGYEEMMKLWRECGGCEGIIHKTEGWVAVTLAVTATQPGEIYIASDTNPNVSVVVRGAYLTHHALHQGQSPVAVL